MKKVMIIIMVLLMLSIVLGIGWRPFYQQQEENLDTILFIGDMNDIRSEPENDDEYVCDDESSSVIDKVCKQFEGDYLTMDEIAHWDSMNAEGGSLLIRGAERDLDTIVNHVHIVFITEP